VTPGGQAVLGDPLAGLPLPPWRPEPLRAAAAAQRAAAGALGGVASRASAEVAGVVGPAWIGTAASSCGQLVARLAAAHEAAARHAQEVAARLDACAATWDRARATYQQARRLADEALREERAHHDAALARAAAPGVLGGLAAGGQAGYASPLRPRAALLANQAIDEVQQAARDAAAALDAHARALAPAPPPPVGHRDQGTPWYRHVLGWLGDRGEDLAGAGRSLLDFGGYAATHPRQTAGLGADAAGMAIGLLGIAAGTGGEVGGLVADTSIVGLPIGIPLNLAGAGLAATGVAVTSGSALKANRDLGAMWAEAQSESSSGGSEAQPGGAPAGPTPGANELLGSARQVAGRFPRTAGPNEVLVRRGADGAPTNYEVYGDDGLPLKRVDLTGRSHEGVDTPHVVEFERHVNPNTGEVFLKPGRVRPARPDEVPRP
jgi:hypothetical protein